MPRDTQIFSGADHAGNSDYTLPGNSEIEVLAVNANFKDNGAGADWCPAVVMFSDSGHVIARAMLPDVKVTAGDDAEVSWFPGVKPGGAASAASPLAYTQGIRNDGIFGDPPFVVPAGIEEFHPFPNTTVSDSSVFQWNTSSNPNDELVFLKSGYYILSGSAGWEFATFLRSSYVDVGGPDIHGPTPNSLFTTPSPRANPVSWTNDYRLVVATAGATAHELVFNGDTVNRNVIDATLVAFYLGSS